MAVSTITYASEDRHTGTQKAEGRRQKTKHVRVHDIRMRDRRLLRDLVDADVVRRVQQ